MARLFVFLLLGIGFCQCLRLEARFQTMRIIDGELADIQDFPYMVSLQNNGTFYGHDFDHFCCGSIVNDKWIITTAQCAEGRQADSFQVRVGSAQYYEDGAVYKIDSVVLHPKFNELSRDYDVGLIKVTERIVFNENVQPVSLPEANDVIQVNANFTIAGWGAKELLGKISDDLLKSQIQTISDTGCRSAYGTNLVTDRMFCVFSEGFGPCVGDSGSPAIYENKLIGLASWSYSCAYQNPTVYTRVSSVLDWIEDITA